MKYDFTFTEQNVINTTIYAKSKEEAEQKILNGEYKDEGGGYKSIHTIVCNSEEWKYPEDTWVSVSHAGKSFDLNFWTDEDKKMLTIYAIGKEGKTDFDNFMSFELRGIEGDIKSIVKDLRIDEEGN